MNKVIRKVMRYFLAPFLLLCLVISTFFLLYRGYLRSQIKKKTKIANSQGIESLEEVNLGGVKQWILIRGQDKSNPVLLFLHGGPGQPIIYRARELGVGLKLEQNFVMVYWDQRGSGKSYNSNIPSKSMNIEQFVSDTHELVEILRKRFKVPKIYLFGRSWGTIIGALTAARYPELFYAYIGVGQFVDGQKSEKISYQFALDSALRSKNQKAIRELKRIGPPPYGYKKFLVRGKWVDKFGGVTYEREDKYELFRKIKMALLSPEMTLTDVLKVLPNLYFSLKLLYDELMEVNLLKQAPKIEVPVYFLQGRHDYLTPSELVEEYYQKLEAPRGKELVWFENSAHIVTFEEPEKFYEVIVDKILKETYKN